MNRQEFIAKLEEFGYPKSEYMILSGGSMLIRGLWEETADFDLCISEKLAGQLDLEHCPKDGNGYYAPFENVQMSVNLGSRPYETVGGFQCETLESILELKRRLLRPKDFRDIAVIEAALGHSGGEELILDLADNEWPYEYTRQHRQVVRAIVTDSEGWYYFVRARRDDAFGNVSFIETSGGGVEAGEDLETALRRELMEELGAEVDILCKIGIVSDYYNLIHRHNINHYYLCRAKSFGERHLTADEIEKFHLFTLKLTYEEAVSEYERCRDSKIGRLIAARELPILKRAHDLIKKYE